MNQRTALSISLLVILVGILTWVLPVAARPATDMAQVSSWRLSSVNDWTAGEVTGLLVTNNAGGELRLAADASEGSFISAPLMTVGDHGCR
jgi:uncharacterized protein YjeT (DUF2065 family)